MAFVKPTSITTPEAEAPKYTSGYTTEFEEKIRREKLALEQRDLDKEPVTLEEFRDIIIPWFRINRTEEFILHPEKEKKVKVPREPRAAKAPRVPKAPKPLTKKQSNDKYAEIAFKLALKQPVSDEEMEFYNNYEY